MFQSPHESKTSSKKEAEKQSFVKGKYLKLQLAFTRVFRMQYWKMKMEILKDQKHRQWDLIIKPVSLLFQVCSREMTTGPVNFKL